MTRPLQENVASDRVSGGRLDNAAIAGRLERVADLLEAQNANPYRLRAYRHGARSVRAYSGSIADLALAGNQELEALPGVGPTIAASIRELVKTGGLRYLRRLEGDAPAETLLRTVPVIGARTAHRIHSELGVETLEDLEVAAHDGRLARLRGFGPRRVRAIQEIVGAMLDRRGHGSAASVGPCTEPDVGTLLSVDEEYRVGADVGALPRITPKRFNPNREAWLPILHTERGDWHFTALFSNSARAHERHGTHDWVIVYFERKGEEGQCTVVTETRGPLKGRRVVRGREGECAVYYSSPASAA